MDTVTVHLTDYDHLPYKLAIKQGATYFYPALIYTGIDLTAWNFRGQIRDNFLSAGGEILAEFTFRPVVMEELPDPENPGMVIPRSIVIPGLEYTKTALLDPTGLRARTDSEVAFEPGINCWVYDIEGERNGEVIRLADGFVQCRAEVTADV